MLKRLYGNYWRFGFRTRLYDLLTPYAYLDSLDRCAGALQLREGERVLDAGCGSGLGFLALTKQNPRVQVHYVGMDILQSGLEAGQVKARNRAANRKTFWVRADLSQPAPFRGEMFDKIMAHFSVYTLAEKAQRLSAWKSLHQVLTPGGTLVAANPSTDYDSRKIIEDSLNHPVLKKSALKYWQKRGLYCVTERLGLRHIESQLRVGYWHAYAEGELEQELADAGFIPAGSQSVYAGSGWMVVASKP